MEIEEYNKNLVIDQKYKLLSSLIESNRHLENKASAIVQTGGIILGLVAAFGLANISQPLVSLWPLGFAFLFFLISVGTYLWSLYPKGNSYPGPIDWDTTFANYLYTEGDVCFEQILSDALSSLEKQKSRNEEKAQLTIVTGGAFILQLVALLVFIAMI